jgi:hypothetical protein
MVAYMATLSGGKAWRLVLRVGWSIKVESNSQHTSLANTRSHKVTQVGLSQQFHHILNDSLKLKSWDVTSMLGVGTWDFGTPCEPALSWALEGAEY